MKITVLYNKPAARFTTHSKNVEAEEDTEESAEEVVAALKEKGAVVSLVPITEKKSPRQSVRCPMLLFLTLLSGQAGMPNTRPKRTIF